VTAFCSSGHPQSAACPWWTVPSGHPAAAPRRCRTPDTAAAVQTAEPDTAVARIGQHRGQTGHRRRRCPLRPSMRLLPQSGQHAKGVVRLPTLVNPPDRCSTGGHQRPASADTGHAFRTTGTPSAVDTRDRGRAQTSPTMPGADSLLDVLESWTLRGGEMPVLRVGAGTGLLGRGGSASRGRSRHR
jgi:hypothetical protein